MNSAEYGFKEAAADIRHVYDAVDSLLAMDICGEGSIARSVLAYEWALLNRVRSHLFQLHVDDHASPQVLTVTLAPVVSDRVAQVAAETGLTVEQHLLETLTELLIEAYSD